MQSTYIKWDHNRVPADAGPQRRHAWFLRADRPPAQRDFPDVEIESCASGGGRIDFGILGRTQAGLAQRQQ